MAIVEDFETTIKIIVVGNGGVGKSSMIRRFCKGEYTDTYKKTIGVDFLEKEKYIDSVAQNITFMVWDTAGQEEFDAITRSYYRNANGCVVAFSTVDRDSFEAVEKWKSKVEAEVGQIPMVLVQNKVDLIDQSVVTPEEVDDLAKKLKLKLYRTCVSENLNVDKVFEYLGEQYVKTEQNGGVSGLASIEEMSTSKASTSASAGTSTNANPKPVKATTDSKRAETSEKATDSSKQNDRPRKADKKDVIQIHDIKQRTGGKKKRFCSIL